MAEVTGDSAPSVDSGSSSSSSSGGGCGCLFLLVVLGLITAGIVRCSQGSQTSDSSSGSPSSVESSGASSTPVEPSPPPRESLTYGSGGGYKFTFSNIYLRKVASETARSGYVFQFVGNVTNDGKEEFTRIGSAVSQTACMIASIKDDQDRKFDVSCEIPPLLPSETSEPVVFAQSTAMPDSRTAEFCITWGNCTSQMTPE